MAGNNYCHIAGVDIVRAGQGEFYVLEDNLRVPSGVSYMLEDRKMMMRLFPEVFNAMPIAPNEHYSDLLVVGNHQCDVALTAAAFGGRRLGQRHARVFRMGETPFAFNAWCDRWHHAAG